MVFGRDLSSKIGCILLSRIFYSLKICHQSVSDPYYISFLSMVELEHPTNLHLDYDDFHKFEFDTNLCFYSPDDGKADFVNPCPTLAKLHTKKRFKTLDQNPVVC